MNNQNKIILLLISVFFINFLISDNISYNFSDSKAVFAQEVSGQFTTYTNEKYNLTIQYPSDWTKTEVEGKVEDDESITIVTFSKDIYDYKGDVSLYLDPNQSMSLEEYLSSTIEVYEELYEDFDFELVSSNANTDKTLSGHPAYILEYNLEEELANTNDNINTKYQEIGAKIGNNYYYVEYFAEEGDDYDANLPIAQKMIDSIKIDSVVSSALSSQPQPQPQPQIIITKSNTPPTAMNSSVVTIQNNAIDIPLKIHDNEGNMVDISVIEAPKFGELAIKDLNTKTLTYTPNPNYTGYDSFIFQGNDRKASSNNATISIIVGNPLGESTSPPNGINNNSVTFSTKAVTQSSANQSSTNSPNVSTSTQDLNNLNQAQLVDLISSKISNANNIDKNKVIQTINDFIKSTKTKTSNVMEPLKKLAGIILNDPSGIIANNIINTAKTK